MSEQSNPWKTLSSRIAYQNHWLTLYEDDVITPSGHPGKYTYTESPPFVLMVGYHQERFILVRQYRYPAQQPVTEFPGGGIEEGEAPLAAAQREFEEETGFRATKWTELGTINNPNLATVFLAEDLVETGTNNMKEEGITGMIQLTWAEIDQLIPNGELNDSKTLAALLLFNRHHMTA